MSDSLHWLYRSFLLPQLDQTTLGEVRFHRDLLANELPPQLAESLEQVQEAAALGAFLLGLRLGQALPR